MKSRAKIGLTLAFCTSVGVHGVAYASLAGNQRDPVARDFVSEVSIEVKPLPPPVAPPEPPTPLPEPARSRSPEPALATRISPPTPATPSAPPPSTPAPAPALDLSGVTLTNDTGTGFAIPVGDGSA
ncbi:MAG: hypothetical protein ABW061_22765, partial [Polyangiaceae bacterium]